MIFGDANNLKKFRIKNQFFLNCFLKVLFALNFHEVTLMSLKNVEPMSDIFSMHPKRVVLKPSKDHIKIRYE